MEHTTTILLIILGSVSGILIIILTIVGIQIWRLLHTVQKIASIMQSETEHVHSIIKRVRTKIHKILE